MLVTLSRTWRALFATAILQWAAQRRACLSSKGRRGLPGWAHLRSPFVGADTTKNHKERVGADRGRAPFGTFKKPSHARHPIWCFPKADGSMMPKHTPLEDVLRSALARAGIVIGYRHVCRRKGCGHAEQARVLTCGNCPKCGMKLWAQAMCPATSLFMI